MGSKRVAALTIVRDEPFFLPLWHRHYASAFSESDLYCLHHVSSADEKSEEPFASALALFRADCVERVVNKYFDPVWLRQCVCERIQALLSGSYDAVLFAEVDELLLPAPTRGSLIKYVEEFAASDLSAVRCIGFEMHHDLASEPPFDPTRTLLEQRSMWHRNDKYSKALLSKIPLTWSLGFHTCEQEVPVDKDWILVHLHKYDFHAFLQRHEARCKYQHAPSAIENDWNAHYRTSGAALVAQYINLPATLEPIPGWVREALAGI
mmetsp:Transcript_22935/g.58336  ORF Transcript_22935/g.58336 Transcript_22935/m.58336 type:complete len:265 (-) Transcript_22935:274-1068(-)